jgi:ribosomal-protein-alanine N-acetyltransferase
VIVAESKRLALRELIPDDFLFLHRMFNDSEVMKFYNGLRNEQQTRSWMEFNLNNYKKFGFGKWVMVRKKDNEPIGHCGFQPTVIDGVEEMEIGYFLDRAHWKQGFATEGATAALTVGFEKLQCSRIVSAIDPRNEPSIALALRLGMKKEKFSTARIGEIIWEADVYVIEKPKSFFYSSESR